MLRHLGDKNAEHNHRLAVPREPRRLQEVNCKSRSPTMTTVAGTYDLHLVALSFAVACLASYTALDLAGRIRASDGPARGVWLATAAISMGGGIWSMHFIAMLAFLMPMVVTFDVALTVLSLVLAIVFTGGAFYVVGLRRVTALHLSLSGVFMGSGIVAMHYTGMAAMRMPAGLDV